MNDAVILQRLGLDQLGADQGAKIVAHVRAEASHRAGVFASAAKKDRILLAVIDEVVANRDAIMGG